MSNSETLILTSNKKTIKVNNKGDEIVLDLDDMSMQEKINKFRESMDKFVVQIRDSKSDDEKYKYSLEMSKEAVIAIDDIFGENASMKLFGNLSPTIDLIFEFCYKLNNLFPKLIKNKTENIEKMINISKKINNNKYLRRQR
jgi:hypothetical protein